MQLVLYLPQKGFVIAPTHRIVDMPSCQAPHTPFVVCEDSMIDSTTNKTLTLQFLSQRFVKHICCLFDAVERGVESSDQALSIGTRLLVSTRLMNIDDFINLPMQEGPLDVQRVQLPILPVKR